MLIAVISAGYAQAGTSCYPLVPFEKLGPVKIGQMIPARIGRHLVVRDSRIGGDAGWKLAGPWRLRADSAGRVDYIQYELETNPGCLTIKKNRVTRSVTFERLKKLFPQCRHEVGIPSPITTCDGFQLMFTREKDKVFLRADVNSESLADRDAQRASEAVRVEWASKKIRPILP